MKKILAILVGVIVLVIIASLLFSGLGWGTGNGNGDGEGTGLSEEQISDQEEDEKTEGTTEPEVDDTESTERQTDKLVVAVSVVENDYFYQNRKITLEEIVNVLDSLDEDYVVEVTDDNASLKAYNKLIDTLSENSVDYIEKS